MNHAKRERRLKFYGLNDYGTFFEAKNVVDFLENYSDSKADYKLDDIIELYNISLFIENKILPKDLNEKRRKIYKAFLPKIKKNISLFFNDLNESNAFLRITEINYDYKQDLLYLLVKYKINTRISSVTFLSVLRNIDISIDYILKNKEIVRSYEDDIRLLIIADHKNAEHIACKYLEVKDRYEIYLPSCLTPSDTSRLLNDYVDSDDANANYVKLIAESQVNKIAGIDAKLKLKARRKYDSLMDKLFDDDKNGSEYGCEVSISDDQREPVVFIQDGLVNKYSYSRKWLEENSTPAETVSNFINLFGFVNQSMILTLPSYKVEIGTIEGIMGIMGEREYPVGVAFRLKDMTTFLQTAIYEKFLQSRGDGLEMVLNWFFADYLNKSFGAKDFKYSPSSKASTYLEKSRHLFTEMESIIKQFTFYVENGEIEKELFSITSGQVPYNSIPSLIPDKYVYTTEDKDIQSVMFFLFSDQSGLGYINDSVNATTFVELLTTQQIKYDDISEHDRSRVDKLISLDILEKQNELIKFRCEEQILVLKNLYDYDALSYYRCSSKMMFEINDMVHKKWLTRRASLLTSSEASYVNYVLNQKEFSNGPDLRNKYLHGAQSNKDDENAHYNTYIKALKLMMALTIKINDDFLINSKIDQTRS